MKQFINNPVTLHFYSPEERLPETTDSVIVIYKTDEFTKCTICNGYTVIAAVKAEERRAGGEKTIAWATFSPDWVVTERGES